jgi:hypothetical protein
MAAYRDDVEALSARHDALAAEVAAKTRELDAAANLLADAKAKAKLPILDNIRVATPCSADWAQMTGDERVRHCGACQKNVYNLSSMTREEAQALIVEKEGKLCVRYFQRADGTILTADCTVGIRRKRKVRVLAAGAVALLAGGGALAMKLLEKHAPEATMGAIALPMTEQVDIREVQGDIAPPPEDHHEVKGRLAVPDDDVFETMGEISVPEPAPQATTK